MSATSFSARSRSATGLSAALGGGGSRTLDGRGDSVDDLQEDSKITKDTEESKESDRVEYVPPISRGNTRNMTR